MISRSFVRPRGERPRGRTELASARRVPAAKRRAEPAAKEPLRVGPARGVASGGRRTHQRPAPPPRRVSRPCTAAVDGRTRCSRVHCVPHPPPPGPRPCVRLCVRACVAAAAVCVDDADETPTASCCGRRVFFLRRWLPVVVRRRPRITGFGRAEFLSGGRRERWWPPSCFFFHLLPLHLSVRRCCRVAPAAFFPVKNTHTHTHTDTHRHTGAQCEWWEEAKQVDEGWEAARSG